MDKLKEFITNNRDHMDTFNPSATLWGRIDAGLFAPGYAAPTPKPLGSIAKIALVTVTASAITVGTIFYSTKNKNKNTAPPSIAPADTTQTVVVPDKKTDSPTLQNKTIHYADTPGEKFMKWDTSTFFPFVWENKMPEFTMPEFDFNMLHVPPAPVMPVLPDFNVPSGLPQFSKEIIINSDDKYNFKIDTSFSGIEKIEVYAAFCNVNIVQDNGELATVKGEVNVEARGIHSKISEYKIRCEKNGKTLKVELTQDGQGKIFMIGSYNLQAQVNISLPKASTLVYAETHSGDMDIKNITGENLTLKSTSGNIKLSNINAPTDLSSYSGDITAENIVGTTVFATTSGNQTLKNLAGNTTIRSYSGEVRLNKLAGNLSCHTTSGNQYFGDVKGNIEVKSYSGEVQVDDSKGVVTASTTSGNITGNNVELTGNVSVQSYSGDINLGLVNDVKDLSFDLSSYSGDLIINKNGSNYNAERKLTVNQGNIMVKGSTTSGNQSYK